MKTTGVGLPDITRLVTGSLAEPDGPLRDTMARCWKESVGPRRSRGRWIDTAFMIAVRYEASSSK
jgi:hypothetical protein